MHWPFVDYSAVFLANIAPVSVFLYALLMSDKPDLRVFHGDESEPREEPRPISSLPIGNLSWRAGHRRLCGTVELQKFDGGSEVVQIQLEKWVKHERTDLSDIDEKIYRFNECIRSGFSLADRHLVEQKIEVLIQGSALHVRRSAWRALDTTVRDVSSGYIGAEPLPSVRLDEDA
jgi:hypothetical protein